VNLGEEYCLTGSLLKMDRVRILIAEDELIVARDTENMLLSLGYEVLGLAATAEEAIALAGELSPDLILMDIRLKGDASGIEAATRIRDLYGLPVVFVSALADETTLERAKIAEPMGYLLKPYEEKDLRMMIEMAVFKWKTERELKKRELQYRNLVENLREGIAHLDAEDQFIFANTAAHEIFGVEPGSLVGRRLLEFEDGKQPALLRAEMFDRRSVQTSTYELRIRRPGGGVRDLWITRTPQLDSKGELQAAFCVLHDITDRKRAEEAIQREANKLSTMIEGMEEGVAFIDNQARLIEANEFFLRLFDVAKGDILGRTLWESELGATFEEFRGVIADFTRSGNSGQTLLQKQVSGLKTVVRVQPIYRHDVYEGSIFNVIDVTELVLAREQALAASKAKSSFLANMSHEIRTPLNAIVGITDLMFDTGLSPQQKDYVGTIQESSKSLLAIVNDILDFSKIEAGRIELEVSDFELQKVIDGVCEILAGRAQGKGLEFSCSVDPQIPSLLRGDSGRLRQILLNLGDNAVKFTAQGNVTIRVEPERPSKEGVLVRFSVVDTGIGIAPENQDLIFQGFTQADSSITRRFGGTGLGLSICKQLVKIMGGEIGLTSPLNGANGGGSCFWFIIPFQTKAADEPTVGDAAPETSESFPFSTVIGFPKTVKILLAEDNPVNQKVTVAILQKAGYSVDVVENGKKAVEAAERIHYDLVLMDLQMPEMDGLRAAELLRAKPEREGCLPIIALTANAEKEERERCLSSGIQDYITKPIQPKDLIAKVEKWTRRAAI
jgi:PAS domain S-box-containing protein